MENIFSPKNNCYYNVHHEIFLKNIKFVDTIEMHTSSMKTTNICVCARDFLCVCLCLCMIRISASIENFGEHHSFNNPIKKHEWKRFILLSFGFICIHAHSHSQRVLWLSEFAHMLYTMQFNRFFLVFKDCFILYEFCKIDHLTEFRRFHSFHKAFLSCMHIFFYYHSNRISMNRTVYWLLLILCFSFNFTIISVRFVSCRFVWFSVRWHSFCNKSLIM